MNYLNPPIFGWLLMIEFLGEHFEKRRNTISCHFLPVFSSFVRFVMTERWYIRVWNFQEFKKLVTILNICENGFSKPTVNMTSRKRPFFCWLYRHAIPTVNFTEDAGRWIFDVETPNFAHSILRHTHTFSALPVIKFRKKFIFGPS